MFEHHKVMGNSKKQEAPVMSTSIRKSGNKQGILMLKPFTKMLELKLWKEDIRIGYAHCIPDKKYAYNETKYGYFLIGSPLSYQLHTVEDCFKLVQTNHWFW